jgi:hypothetical protein
VIGQAETISADQPPAYPTTQYVFRETLTTFPKKTTDNELLHKLFNPHSGLLSSFGPKVWVARACELLDHETYLALEAIRGVRNACAHENFKIKLSHRSVEKEIASLRSYISPQWFGENWEETGATRLKQNGIEVSGSEHLYFLLAAMQAFTQLSLVERDLKERQSS